MKRINPQARKIARGISVLCAIGFVVFTFLFLYVFECDVLAQTQYRLSEGATVYHPLLAALLSTLLLTLLGLFLSKVLGWLPLRMKASIWFLPFLLVGALSHWRFPEYGDAGTAPGWMSILLLLLAYVLWLIMGRTKEDPSKGRFTFPAYAWPNLLQLIFCMGVCVWLSNTDIVLHRTLAAGRHTVEREYGRVLRMAQWEVHPSHQLSAMTALALSETGQLGDALFAYPQPYGSEGLLPRLSDTLMVYNLPRAVGFHLGYKKGDKTPATTFLKLVSDMPNARPAVRDYLLCAHLLDKNLSAFAEVLTADGKVTATMDSLALDSLPRHYREALALYRHIAPDEAPQLNDSVFALQFQNFQTLMYEKDTKEEREFILRRHFGATYWTYFYFN